MKCGKAQRNKRNEPGRRNRRASIGFTLEALQAAYNPLMIPTSKPIINDIGIHSSLYVKGMRVPAKKPHCVNRYPKPIFLPVPKTISPNTPFDN